jgi:polyisoprenoid-binding protein YceI
MKRLTLVTAGILIVLATNLFAGTYGIDPAASGDTVYFRSSAKLEFIEGKTANLTGGFAVDPQNTSSGVTGLFQVDLRTLRTGIEMRDEHMRERHLQTDQYPFAYFSIESVSGLPAALKSDSTYAVSGAGMFYIHGGKRSIPISLEVRAHAGDHTSEGIRVRAKFSLNLDEFGIPRPRAVFLKLAETINVEVIFTAYNNLAPAAVSLPDWSLRK